MTSIILDSSGARIGNTEVKLISFSEKLDSTIETDIDALRGVPTKDYPNLLICYIRPVKDYEILSAFAYAIFRTDDAYHFNISIDEVAGVWSDFSINAVFRETVNVAKESSFSPYMDMQHDEGWFDISYEMGLSEQDLFVAINELLADACSLVEKALTALRGIIWKSEYERNEPLFTTEIVVPLLVGMGYEHVRYNHGVEEYGKDVLFSERDRFGNQRHLAAQVKAGNISGKSGGLIDKILGQIKHAFSMPVQGPGPQKNFHISEMYIISSGSFTNNAVKIINTQVDPALIGSIYYLDKRDIEWLLRRYI